MKKNKIYLGNCLELINKIPNKSIDLVFVDPPYKDWRKVFNVTRRVLKGDISPFRRIQNFEKILITFEDTT